MNIITVSDSKKTVTFGTEHFWEAILEGKKIVVVRQSIFSKGSDYWTSDEFTYKTLDDAKQAHLNLIQSIKLQHTQ